MNNWVSISACFLPEYLTVMLYRSGDLYPVIGFGMYNEEAWSWHIEEGGNEGAAMRGYPLVGGGEWQPTHWAILPGLPL